MQKTPLNSAHKELGAKLIEFGGWEMPVSYSGIIEEHLACRREAALFDVSHMGELFVSGPDALKFISFACSNDVSKLKIGEAQYSLLLNGKGGIVDDIIVYRLSNERYLLCVNASNTNKDFDWLQGLVEDFEVRLEDKSADYVQLALQGPKAMDCLKKLTTDPLPEKPFTLREIDGLGIVARTGYTGEDGVEIFSDVKTGCELWNKLIEMPEVHPAGLGARDTLRLEACYPLYGHELTDETHPYAARLKWVVKSDKEAFIGKAELEQDFQYELAGFEVTGAGIVREGAKLFDEEAEIGWVTSGTKLPYLEKVMFLGYIKKGSPDEVQAEVRGRKIAAKRAKLPFYKR